MVARKSLRLLALGLFQCLPAMSEYVWPSKYDFLEDLLSLQSGYFRKGFIDLVNPCSFGARVPGRQNSAEWIRAAFHDMITHDAATGTGGLDASIALEVNRPENIGGFINNTFGFLNGFYNTRASASDLLAMSVIVALAGCAGPKIAFRAGRIDATELGPTGVPEPHQELETHLDRFETAGLSKSEMIAMVACGHTLGGVHSVDFPEITGGNGDPDNDTLSFFDTTSADFSHEVVTEYLDGTTQNPLVVGANDTTNSDLRVFGADGNKTMSTLADPATFRSTCADLFGRMIDTVPSDVELSEIIEATDIKPYFEVPALNSVGNITFEGRIRIRTTRGTGRDPNDLDVHLTYFDRSGVNSSRVITTKRATFQGGMATGLYGENFLWFEFKTELDTDKGISKFNIHVSTPSRNTTAVYNNAGNGYPVSDAILYQQSESCLNINIVDGKMDLGVVAAVRNDTGADQLILRLVHRVPRQGVIVPVLEERDVEFKKTGDERKGYVFYKATTKLASESWSTTFDIVPISTRDVGAVEFQFTNMLASSECEVV